MTLAQIFSLGYVVSVSTRTCPYPGDAVRDSEGAFIGFLVSHNNGDYEIILGVDPGPCEDAPNYND